MSKVELTEEEEISLIVYEVIAKGLNCNPTALSLTNRFPDYENVEASIIHVMTSCLIEIFGLMLLDIKPGASIGDVIEYIIKHRR